MRYGKWKVRYHLKCCVIVNALIECKITFFKVVRQSLKVFYVLYLNLTFYFEGVKRARLRKAAEYDLQDNLMEYLADILLSFETLATRRV